MTGALIGLGCGLGALLIVLGVSVPRTMRDARVSRLRGLIDRAGLERVSPSGVVAGCSGLALVAGLLVLAISGVVVVGLLAAIEGRPVDHVPLTTWCFGFRAPPHLRWQTAGRDVPFWYS